MTATTLIRHEATITSATAADCRLYDRWWWTLGCLCLSLVLIAANFSSLNVNLPVLQRAFNSSNSGLQWIVDAYGLLFAALLLPAGALADRYGRKTALQFGLAVIGAASLLAMGGGATWQVIACRAVMGVGAAFVMPGTLSILTNVFPSEERGRAIAIWAGFAGFGGVVWPISSGWLLEHLYWGSAFAINVPIVAVALVAGLWLVPDSKHPDETVIDPPGVALVVGGLFALLYGVIEGPERGWLTAPILAALAVGVVLLAAFVAWELHAEQPMLDVRLFTNRGFSVGAGTITLQYFALWGLFFILAQYLELAKGYPPLTAALVIVPIGLLSMVGAPLSAPMVRRFGPRAVVGTGLLCTATGLAILATANPSTPLVLILPAELLIGLGIGQTTAPSTTLIMENVPPPTPGSARQSTTWPASWAAHWASPYWAASSTPPTEWRSAGACRKSSLQRSRLTRSARSATPCWSSSTPALTCRPRRPAGSSRRRGPPSPTGSARPWRPAPPCSSSARRWSGCSNTAPR
jgi:EmrB/QacA subfamily drug resistance transporter